MKLKYFEHYDARTVDEAVSLMREHKGKAKVMAGGTDLIALMKDPATTPEVIVNVKTIPSLAYIKEAADGLRIGALTTINEIEKSSVIKEKYGVLAEAAHSVASPQIRNMGTVAGNLCQDVWCWYYRRSPTTGTTFDCVRKVGVQKGGGPVCIGALEGNDYLSIFGGAHGCFAVQQSDIAPALIALNAKAKTSKKTVALEEFFTTFVPTTVLDADEILTEIQVPTPSAGTRSKYLKFRLRKSIDFAIVSVAIVITLEAGLCKDARIVLGSVFSTPLRVKAAEDVLKGRKIDEALAENAGKVAVKRAVPLAMNAYKVPIAQALIKNALLTLI